MNRAFLPAPPQRCRFPPWLTENTVLRGRSHIGTVSWSCRIVFTNAVNSPLRSLLYLKMNVIHDGWQPGGTGEPSVSARMRPWSLWGIFTLSPDKKNTLGLIVSGVKIAEEKKGCFPFPQLNLWGVINRSGLGWNAARELLYFIEAHCQLWPCEGSAASEMSNQRHHTSTANPWTLSLCVIHLLTLTPCSHSVICIHYSDLHPLKELTNWFQTRDSRFFICLFCTAPLTHRPERPDDRYVNSCAIWRPADTLWLPPNISGFSCAKTGTHWCICVFLG